MGAEQRAGWMQTTRMQHIRVPYAQLSNYYFIEPRSLELYNPDP